MGKLLRFLFLFCFGMWLVVELLDLLIDVILAIWPVLFLAAILVPVSWIGIKLFQNRKKKKADLEVFRIYPDLDTFTDKACPIVTEKKQAHQSRTALETRQKSPEPEPAPVPVKLAETKEADPVSVLPPPDATDWNEEIPVEELTDLLSQRPFYDNYLMRCTPDGRGDLPERFSDLSKFVVLDIETTGLNPQRDRIIEVAAVKFENFQVIETFATLINPCIPLPRRITELTGITHAELRKAPQWQEKQDALLEFIDGYTLVGHNLAGFDIRFLNNAIGEKLPNPLIDTLEYSRTVFPDLPRHKLSYLKQVLGINVNTSHRALDDVKTTFFLLVACMRQEASMEPIYSNMDVWVAENTNTYVPPILPKKVKPSDIPPIAVNADPNNPLYGRRIVFTGELSIPREQAMRLAAEQGAILRTTVSGKTDFLVVGQQDLAVVGADGMSSKEEKAHLLNDLGKGHIQIINETQFRELAGIVS